MTDTSYFSVLRWSLDRTRDEAKNVAILLVDAHGESGGMKAAPVSTISPRLREQGLLDAILVNLQDRFHESRKPDLGLLNELYSSMKHSLFLTEPKPAISGNAEAVLNALYRAYVAPKGGGSGSVTKGRALDRVIDQVRHQGKIVRRGEYLEDFLFDGLIEASVPTALEVVSFATSAQKWSPVEHDVGHFLFALERVKVPGVAVVFPPTERSHQNARHSYERINRWLKEARVPSTAPDSFGGLLASL